MRSLRQSFGLLAFVSLFAILPVAAQEPPFEIRDGDRVLLLGDTLLEREVPYGWIETRMHEQFPDRKFSVRNLSYSADTPRGISRSVFDDPAKGWERLKEQIAMVKPTVVILGYGMASSMDFVGSPTDRMAEPKRTPEEKVARFRKELTELVEYIRSLPAGDSGASNTGNDRASLSGTAVRGTPNAAEASAASTTAEAAAASSKPNLRDAAGARPQSRDAVRLILLSPLKHENVALRSTATRPSGLQTGKRSDLIERGQLAAVFDKGVVNSRSQELAIFAKAAQEVAAQNQARFVNLQDIEEPQGNENITSNGIHPTESGMRVLTRHISKSLGWNGAELSPDKQGVLRKSILRKSELFFHRWRPQNQTYLFGFRKHEQGQNAREINLFDPLVDQAEAVVDALKRGNTPPAGPAEVPVNQPPAVTEDPSVRALPKFDVQEGYEITLWATNPLLEKPIQMNWDAEGRLWVASSRTYPQIAPGAQQADRVLILEDIDRDGKADKSSVFTEGLLIPTGVVPDRGPMNEVGDVIRGKADAYVAASTDLLKMRDMDGNGTADEKEIVLSGFGTEDTHHILHTLRWGPDARLYFNQSIYIHSHIETPWGVVRQNSGGVFAFDPATHRLEVMYNGFWNPWGTAWDKAGEAFITDGAGFQGISWGIRGAAYQTYEGSRRLLQSISPGTYPKFCGLEMIYSPHFPADWQGSAVTCDFRAHRIVRFGIEDLSKGEKPLSGYVTREMPDIARTNDVSFRPIDVKLGPDGALYVADWSNPVINHGEVDFRDARRDRTHGRIWRISRKGAPLVKWTPRSQWGSTGATTEMLSENAWGQEWGVRKFRFSAAKVTDASIGSAIPRERLTAMRELARTPSAENAAAVLTAAVKTPGDGSVADPFYDYAAWLSINDLAEPWTKAVLAGEWKIDSSEREKQLEFALNAIKPEYAGQILGSVIAQRGISQDGSGPWINLIGKAGTPKELATLFQAVAQRKLSKDAAVAALKALLSAAETRNLKPAGDQLGLIINFTNEEFHGPIADTAVRLLGAWQLRGETKQALYFANGKDAGSQDAGFAALRAMGGAEALAGVRDLTNEKFRPEVRRKAAATLAVLDLKGSWPQISEVLLASKNDSEALSVWRALLGAKDAAEQIPQLLSPTLPQPIAAAGLRAAREAGKKGAPLVAALTPLAGAVEAAPAASQDYKSLAELVRRDGNPAEGERIFRRAELACVTCHAIGGGGGKVGPELTSLGASAPLDYIIESTLNPGAKVKEGYHAVNLTLRDGGAASGVLARETGAELILRDAIGKETAVPKANVTKKEDIGSLMPAGLVDRLPGREQLHLFAFMGQLGKPGIYDASKGNVVRAWRLTEFVDPAAADKAAAPMFLPALTNVDGSLAKDTLATTLGMMPQWQSAMATARFAQPTAGKTRLTFTGISEAWLDGKPLAIASEPNVAVELPAGEHTLEVKLDPKRLPSLLRVESPDVRFLAD